MAVKVKDERRRNFACVIYPESAPKNLIDIITHLYVPCILSPLHDKDVNPDGEPKKAHYHFMVCFEGKKSESQAQEVFKAVNGVGMPEVKSVRAMARYFCHLDNPEKAQYKTSDVLSFGGIDYMSIIGSASDKYAAIGEIMDFCDNYQVYSYKELMRYAKKYRMDWFRMLCDSCTMVVKEYLKSALWDKENGASVRETPLPSPEEIEKMEARLCGK